MQELDEYINKVKTLPPAPKILPQLLLLLGDPDVDSSRIVELIAYDQALTANVLQLCNSAFFAQATPATDIQEAVTRLGFRQIYQMVAAVSGARALAPPQKGYGIEPGELWKHSVTAAVAARLIAHDQGEDESLVFTAALMHDIGKIVLSEALEHVYAKLVQQTEDSQQSMLEAEKKLLGVQHAEIGGRLLARWNFPPNLVAAIWHHHHPAEAKPHAQRASYVYIGNMIAYFLGHGYGHQAFALRGRAEAMEILGLTAESLPQYMIKTVDGYESVQALFKVKT
ncbi:MAG: HDOD domain-containing protein [Verrucomicrobia bacterium]|nr:HDOD domain-containing protein [Verrucomicrobiota bacterium]